MKSCFKDKKGISVLALFMDLKRAKHLKVFSLDEGGYDGL